MPFFHSQPVPPRQWIRFFAILLLLIHSPLQAEPTARNIILMIADGAGFNSWQAAAMYQGPSGTPPWHGPQWIHLAVSTYPLSRSMRPGSDSQPDRHLIYDPARAWDPTHGYEWLRSTATDSAAAATALACGVKTYNAAIAWSADNRPLTDRLITRLARRLGKSTGVVTSVPFSHATPAAFGAAVPDRSDYTAIAQQMLTNGLLDVILGAGHPGFDNAGQPIEPRNFQYVGGRDIWQLLQENRHPAGWHLIDKRDDFRRLADGPVPPKLLGVAQVHQTLQQARPGADPADAPFADPPITTVPSLAEMTAVALNALDNNPQGFFLMIEGGAIDWAHHAHQLGRAIEEHLDFQQAVLTVIHWIETHSSWQETLLIITADHETGLLWGPDSDQHPFAPLQDQGPGRLPRARYNSKDHSNSLVPLWARGPGADQLPKYQIGIDPVYGPYIDNTAIYLLMAGQLRQQETFSIAIWGAGGLALLTLAAAIRLQRSVTELPHPHLEKHPDCSRSAPEPRPGHGSAERT